MLDRSVVSFFPISLLYLFHIFFIPSPYQHQNPYLKVKENKSASLSFKVKTRKQHMTSTCYLLAKMWSSLQGVIS